MVQYVTLENLSDISRQALAEARMIKAAQERSPQGTTFLSYSSKDAEYLGAVITILTNHGAQVYIDKKDDTLPPYTNRETAEILRSRIVQCRKFVLFATARSKESKWMPWELGISDGYKKSKHTAIFPAVDSMFEREWAEREYLGVYDRVVWGRLMGSDEDLWLVWNQEENTARTLDAWLAA